MTNPLLTLFLLPLLPLFVLIGSADGESRARALPPHR